MNCPFCGSADVDVVSDYWDDSPRCRSCLSIGMRSPKGTVPHEELKSRFSVPPYFSANGWPGGMRQHMKRWLRAAYDAVVFFALYLGGIAIIGILLSIVDAIIR